MAEPTMISLQRTPAQMKEGSGENVAPERDLYPYGLSLHLDDDTLSSVPFPEGLTVGDQLIFTVKASVRSRSERETTEGASASLELQITDMTEPTKFVAERTRGARVYGERPE